MNVNSHVEPGNFLHTMQGPEFLLLYFGWFIIVWIGVLVLRRAGFDSPALTLGGLMLFEWLAIARIIIGLEHGMHKWGFLIGMMIIGALGFVLRAHHFQGGGSSSSCHGAAGCSGGSCGSGGGCGGGGCGGCGGS